METGEFPALFQGKVEWRLKSRRQQSKFYKMKKGQDQSQGGDSPRGGSWPQIFRYFYAAEAKAAGMPVDQFLDMVGDRLDERGQRPKHFRRERRTQLWHHRKGHPEVRKNFLGIDSIA